MQSGVSLDYWQMTLLLVAGGAGGFIDAIAGGGGLITLPALLAVGVPPVVALGTNKLQSTCGTAIAVGRYTRAGMIGWRALVPAIIVTVISAAAGVWAVTRIDESVLGRVVPVLLLAVAIYTALNPRLGEQTRPARLNLGSFAIGFGIVLGFYDGFFGPGTGSFWMLGCVLVQGQELRNAAGTTKAMNLASNAGAVIPFAIASCIRWDAGLVMITGQLLGARIGSGIVIARGARIIRPIFILTTFALAIRVTWHAFVR